MAGGFFLFFAGLFLAYANGANDNLKGVATLLGSRTVGYRGALAWGTLTTLAGSFGAVILSNRLVNAFSGKGVVPDALVGDPVFLFGVGLGAATVVMGATLLGLPISTTHGLVGGIAGSGAAAAGFGALEWGRLASAFAFPLLISPFMAAALVAILYPIFHSIRKRAGIEHNACICLETEPGLVVTGATAAALEANPVEPPRSFRIGNAETCVIRYDGELMGLTAQRLLDSVHFCSAGAVSFARGLNDTPKIAALLLATGLTGSAAAMVVVGLGMAVGAVLQALRVGRTMSFEITPMNSGQGFTANLMTAFMVFGATRMGVPVSTTHVSVGSLFGLGAATDGLIKQTLKKILLAWVATLPLAFVLGYFVYLLAR